MKKHYECQPLVWHEKPLVFDWDADTGEIDGPDAARIKDMATWGEIEAHPLPWSWTFSKSPLKNKTDMAAIIGRWWSLPDDLASFYPQLEEDLSDLPDNAIVG